MSLPARCLHAHIIKNMMAGQGNVRLPDVLDQISMQTANVELMALTMDGSPIQTKLRRRVKLWRESGNNTATPAQDVSSVNFCHQQFQLLYAPRVPGPGEATHSELLGTKSVRQLS